MSIHMVSKHNAKQSLQNYDTCAEDNDDARQVVFLYIVLCKILIKKRVFVENNSIKVD